MADIAWGDVPTWLTLGAAVIAGFFAGRAAHWTKEQADAAKKQVGFADKQTHLAKQALVDTRRQALDARADAHAEQQRAERAEQRLERSRLDTLMPVVFARENQGLTTGKGLPCTYMESGNRNRSLIEDDREAGICRVTLTLWFKNVSDQVAELEITDSAGGQTLGWRDGEASVIPPSVDKSVIWERVVEPESLSLRVDEEPPVTAFDLRFAVWDLGRRVSDEYEFAGNFALYRRDLELDVGDVEGLAFAQAPWVEIVARNSRARTCGSSSR